MHKPFRSIHLPDATQLLNCIRKSVLSKLSCGLIGVVCICWLTGWAASHQLSADDPPPKLTLPPAEPMLPPQLPPPSPRSENNQRQIEDHLRRAISGDAEVQPSGDVVLDSIIDQLRSKGSVLQGSVLDPHEPVSPQLGAQQLDAQQAQPPSEQACLVAEQLLRSARMLSQLDDHASDPDRRQLIDQLRHQAARLLTPPQPTN
ncbi:hypothetical protein SH139x_005799 [Planctomycetaceae bacterium SH139]